MLNKAIKIAAEAHKDQKDRNGAPYLLHVMRVGLRGKTEDEKICGILHDVVEDTAWTFDDLQNEGFSEEIIEALKCVTKLNDREPYDEFIERIKKNALAVRVKINDLEDNLDIKRMTNLKENDLERLNKYLKAYHELILML